MSPVPNLQSKINVSLYFLEKCRIAHVNITDSGLEIVYLNDKSPGNPLIILGFDFYAEMYFVYIHFRSWERLEA